MEMVGQNELTPLQAKSLKIALLRGINALDKEAGNTMRDVYQPTSAKQALAKLDNAMALNNIS